MAEDRQPDPSDDQPEDPKPEPYRLGGSGGSKGSGQTPGSGGDQPTNPLEDLFSSLAGGDMNALASQLQNAFAMLGGAGSMFSAGASGAESGVNWEVTKDTARKTVASLGPDPSPDGGQQRALATEVVGATDIGLPLSEPGHVALLPTNVAAFGAGLEQSASDVTLYLALRECARQRLFAAAGWLRDQMLTLVEQYARGITIDTSALEEAVGRIDASNLEELTSSVEGGLFEPQKTPEQRAILERLEAMLALVEGWVDEVVSQATAQWMPAARALAEAVRRARATGGPAEETFATLVGLELRPRRMRDAANLWAALRDARGLEGRDAVWSHPDLVPTSTDLDDPLGFVAGDAHSEGAADADIDSALEQLLKGETGEG